MCNVSNQCLLLAFTYNHKLFSFPHMQRACNRSNHWKTIVRKKRCGRRRLAFPANAKTGGPGFCYIGKTHRPRCAGWLSEARKSLATHLIYTISGGMVRVGGFFFGRGRISSVCLCRCFEIFNRKQATQTVPRIGVGVNG